MSDITFTQANQLIKVTLPYVLKDEFKAAFKTASWDKWSKTWNIKDNTRNLNKLNKWKATVEESGVLAAVEALDSAELTEKELINLSIQCGDLKAMLEREAEVYESLVEMNKKRRQLLAEMAQAEKDFTRMQEKVQREKQERANLVGQIETRFKQLVDYRALETAYGVLVSLHRKASRSYLTPDEKGRWDDAQEVFNQADNKVREAGWLSPALGALVGLNRNRPERDNPSDYPLSEVCLIKKLED